MICTNQNQNIMKQTIKNIGKVLLVLLVIFNLLYLFRINYSVSFLKDSFKETQSLTHELKLLKGDLIPDELETLQDSTLVQTLISKLDQNKLNQDSENSLADLREFLQSATSIELPENYILFKQGINAFSISSEGQSLINVSFDNLSQVLTLNSFQEQDTYNVYQFNQFQKDFDDLITPTSLTKELDLSNKFNQFQELESSITNDERFSKLQEKNLEVIPAFHKSETAYLDILKEGEPMISLSSYLNKDSLTLTSQSNESLIVTQNTNELIDALYNHIENKEFKTLIEENIQAKINYIQKTINDTDLQKALQEHSYQIAEPINDDNQYLIIIQDQNLQEVLNIKIDKLTAKTTINSQGEESQIDFRSLNFELPEIEKDSENHLILGKHGSLTDTIVIANFNNIKKEVKLVSLPRDLYLDNKKINSIYVYRGMNSLIQEIESIAGIQIDKYALVDMYTFIDVVDTLGGIDVELDKPLIDPSYTTYDNDQWGTLNLSAGTHNVNGRQALRIARSRYSTSDFDRAHRQHLILDGLKNRIKNLGAKDAKTITELALLGVESTETNLDFKDVLKYYGKYKDYELADSLVLSTANVLTSTYTGALNSDPNSTEEAKNRGAYILLPKNDDWFLLRTFIYSFLAR